MNILLASNYFYPQHMGGVEVVSFNLVQNYRNRGHTVHWVAANVPPTLREESNQDIPVKVWNITEEKFGFPHPIPHPEVLLKLYHQTRWCDIVHLQDVLYPINVLSFILAKMLHKPILVTQYAKIIFYKSFFKRLFQILAYQTIGRFMFSGADRVVFITKNVRDNMQYLVGKKN